MEKVIEISASSALAVVVIAFQIGFFFGLLISRTNGGKKE